MYRYRLSRLTSLVVHLTSITLPHLHIPNLGRGSSLKVFLDYVAPFKIKLKIALWTLQPSSTLLTILFKDKAVSVDSCLATVSSSGHSLSISIVSNIPCGEHSPNAGLGLVPC